MRFARFYRAFGNIAGGDPATTNSLAAAFDGEILAILFEMHVSSQPETVVALLKNAVKRRGRDCHHKDEDGLTCVCKATEGAMSSLAEEIEKEFGLDKQEAAGGDGEG